VQSLKEAEFLAPSAPHHRHRAAQRRLIITERDERLMEQ
jgi:hypothetical protein